MSLIDLGMNFTLITALVASILSIIGCVRRVMKMSDALTMLGDLPLGTLDQMSDIRDTLKAFGKNDVQIIITATNIDVKPINAGGDFE